MDDNELTVAFWVAALALVGNLIFALWTWYRDVRGLAGALAGEVGAYVAELRPQDLAGVVREIARLPIEQRRPRLRLFGGVPDSHPVFDKVADKLGLLPPEDAIDIAKFYNVITGMRLLNVRIGSDAFAEQQDGIQQNLLAHLAGELDRGAQEWPRLVERLTQIAKRKSPGFPPRQADKG